MVAIHVLVASVVASMAIAVALMLTVRAGVRVNAATVAVEEDQGSVTVVIRVLVAIVVARMGTVVIRLSPHFFKSASRISPHSVGLKMRINIYGSVYCDRANPKSKIVICLLPSIFSREIFETVC